MVFYVIFQGYVQIYKISFFQLKIFLFTLVEINFMINLKVALESNKF